MAFIGRTCLNRLLNRSCTTHLCLLPISGAHIKNPAIIYLKYSNEGEANVIERNGSLERIHKAGAAHGVIELGELWRYVEARGHARAGRADEVEAVLGLVELFGQLVATKVHEVEVAQASARDG